MSPHLYAPYSSTMRPGTGFNSFTQEICVNDAVTHAARNTAFISGTSITGDGVATQEIIRSAKFVEHISEVMEAMNISPALLLKCDAMSGTGSAHASFFDPKTFAESDLNYLIQVKVVCREVFFYELTDFSPIEGISPAEFTRVYGDSFVAGFAEGGEFHALVSVKLRDTLRKEEVRKLLTTYLNFQGGPSSYGEDAAKEITEILPSHIDGETSITVSWRSGDSSKTRTDANWTLATLRAAAVNFPNHAMAYPVRTNAILRKYISLRSFHEKSPKCFPVDYGGAGIYTSALLDDYIGYKHMWRNLKAAMAEVVEGQSELIARPNIAEIEERDNATNHESQEERRRHDFTAPTPQSTDQEFAVDDNISLSSFLSSEDEGLAIGRDTPTDMPIPPFPRQTKTVVPYAATIVGLDKARGACRSEMTKIMKELAIVCGNPKVARDPVRAATYMNPETFSLLLPRVKSHDEEKKAVVDRQEMEKRKADDYEQLRKVLEDTQKEVEVARGQVATLEAVKKEIDPWAGCFSISLNTPVRLISRKTNKSLDFCWCDGKGTFSVHQYDSVMTPNQCWTIVSVGRVGYFMRHLQSGRYLTIGDVGNDGRVYLTTRTIGSAFLFEPIPGGLWRVHLADHLPYTLNIEGGTTNNRAKAILWPHSKDEWDSWSIKPFDVLSIS